MYQTTVLEFLNMGGGEIALIMVAILLLFGGKKLPELAKGLGKGIREFKDASEGVKREIHRNINSVDGDAEIAERIEERKLHHPETTAPVQVEGEANTVETVSVEPQLDMPIAQEDKSVAADEAPKVVTEEITATQKATENQA